MHESQSPPPRERRTAWFLVAVMVFAFLWFAGQAGWFSNVVEENPSTAAPPSPARQITQRRGLMLPLLELATLSERLDKKSAASLNDNGINWLMVRMPVWTPTPRRFEYNGFDLDHFTDIVATAHAAGMGVTLAPVYWDGIAVHGIPPVSLGAPLFGQYRDMLLDLASVAAESGADALLLDGLFGNTAVSAGEWVDLLAELRAVYSGRIEGSFEKGHIPAIYIDPLDGACLELSGSDSTSTGVNMFDALIVAYPDKGVTALMPESDRYSADGTPWQPAPDANAGTANLEQFLSTAFLSSPKCDGFFLSGERTFRILTADPEQDHPIIRRLHTLRDENLKRLLGKGRREQTITQ